jgi:hypothetical protein
MAIGGIMRNVTTLAFAFCLTAVSSYAAQRYTGRLLDADCYNQNKVASQESGHKTYNSITKTCAATESTTNFAVRITGSPYGADIGNTVMLDAAGNAQVMSAMKNGSLPKSKNGVIRVRVRGDLKGETLTNASVDARGRKNSA